MSLSPRRVASPPRSGPRRVVPHLCRRVLRPGLVALAALLFLGVSAGVAQASSKVGVSPAAFTLTEGTSTDIQFTLDAPIIVPLGASPTVTLTFTPADPSRFTFSPSTIDWNANEWSQVRTLHVTAVLDGIYDASNTDVVNVATASGALYYNGFTTSFTVTLNDVDPPPTTTTVLATTTVPATPTTTAASTTTTAQTPPHAATTTSTTTPAPVPPTTAISVDPAHQQLPATGAPLAAETLLGAATTAAGLALTARVRRRRTRAPD